MTYLNIEILNRDDLRPEYLEQRQTDLEKQLTNFSELGDYSSEKYLITNRELQKLREISELVLKLSKLIKENEQLVEIRENDELFELAKQEIDANSSNIERLLNELGLVTTRPLPNDEKNAIFEFRPGVGGIEASLFCEDLYRMYTKFFSEKNIKFEVYSIDYDKEGGIKQAIIELTSKNSYGDFRFESGVHRVQRVPTTEASGRIHTSTASVVVLPKTDSTGVAIRDEDLKIDVYRASGPGGQSVNTTDSAVRITHIPTGIVVTCQNGKSQHKNKEMALSVLISRISKIEEDKKSSEESNLRQAAISGGDRSVKIRTYNFPQGRITDHRIGRSWFNIDEVMNGKVEEIVTEVNKELRTKIEDQYNSSNARSN